MPTNAITGPNADPDKDGQTNFAEYVFHTSPVTGRKGRRFSGEFGGRVTASAEIATTPLPEGCRKIYPAA